LTTVDDAQHDQHTTDVTRRLTMLLMDQLDLDVSSNDRGVFTLAVPEELRESLGRGARVEFAFDRQLIDTTDNNPADLVTPDGDLFNWLLGQYQELRHPLYASPRNQTTQVHELTKRLFSAYEIEDGQVQLAGCAMTDRLFARVTLSRSSNEPSSGDRLVEVFVDEHGGVISAEQIQSLELDDVAGLAKPPELVRADKLQTLIGAAQQSINGDTQLIATTLVWSKYCHGKLRFTIGEASAELPFEGWAETLQAPPFVCPETGKSSYHVVATGDGDVTVAEAVETCAVSGSKMFGEALETCAVSGQRANAEHLVDCPVTHGRLLRTELVICPACTQAVSPRCIANEQCRACWPLPAVDKDDPRMARILDEHPGLDRWRNWNLKETDDWYLLEARGLVRRLLIVIATDTLEPLHLASGNRLGRKWIPIDRARYEEFLR
jgi:hypothetical protein